MMKRIFHPIGQGAFYSEQFEKANVVYDCGVLRDKKFADLVVTQSFKKNDVIDILFISHFDDDHINKIKVLKDHCEIKKVVLPLLHDDKRFLIVNIYRALGFTEEADLVGEPESFFGGETKILYVKPSENFDAAIGSIILINTTSDKEIESKTPLTLSEIPDWVYMPFNYEYHARNTLLEDEIKKAGLDIKQIKTDVKYALEHKKEIHKAYDSVDGKINENSMLVYSGPFDSKKYHHLKTTQINYPPYLYSNMRSNRVACIFSGDSDFNKVNIKTVFSNYWDMVGTVQVPHHGSINNFNTDFFDDKAYYCPLSAGKENRYGHPSSSVIADIFANKSFPFVINECGDSRFIQII